MEFYPFMVPLIAYSKSNICSSSKNEGALDSGNRPESKFFFESGISLLVIVPKDRKGLKWQKTGGRRFESHYSIIL